MAWPLLILINARSPCRPKCVSYPRLKVLAAEALSALRACLAERREDFASLAEVFRPRNPKRISAMRASSTAGALVVIGGAEDKQERCDILRTFIRLAGGAKGSIVVLTVASEYPKETGSLYH